MKINDTKSHRHHSESVRILKSEKTRQSALVRTSPVVILRLILRPEDIRDEEHQQIDHTYI